MSLAPETELARVLRGDRREVEPGDPAVLPDHAGEQPRRLELQREQADVHALVDEGLLLRDALERAGLRDQRLPRRPQRIDRQALPQHLVELVDDLLELARGELIEDATAFCEGIGHGGKPSTPRASPASRGADWPL